MQTTQMSISKNLMNLRNLYNLVRNIDIKEIRAVFQNQLNKDINILIKTHCCLFLQINLTAFTKLVKTPIAELKLYDRLEQFNQR